jgi:fructose-1,6-bisphosphatase/inositol monophosphatase family enzyme
VLSRYMPDGVGDRVKAALEPHVRIDPSSGCAAIEYTDTLNGAHDFVVYHRLLPWDHAAPALLLTEAGGRVCHASGQPYTARSKSQLTIVARDAVVAHRLCGWITP